MTNTPETLNILNPDFRMPEHCGGDRWSILHGDSLQILRQFEPNSFDAIITDPPYASGGSSQTTKNRSTNEKYSSMSKDKALPDFDSDQMDQLSWMFWTAAWLQDARRIAKPGAPVCLFIDWRQLPAMTLALQWAGWTWRGVAVWDKVASRPQKGRFRQQSEYIVWGSNGKMPLERNVGCLPGVFRYPNPQNRIHVTEKPLQLMQCACCGERLYWRPRTQQWTCRQCGMWSKPMQPENMAQQIVDRLYQIQQHPEIIHNPKEQCNTRSIEVAQLDHEIHTALALPELDADAIIDKILRRAELQFNYCAAGDDDPTTMQIKRACKEFKPTDTFPESFYSSIVSKIILHLDTHIDIKLRNGQTL